jgi:hypothetical protein
VNKTLNYIFLATLCLIGIGYFIKVNWLASLTACLFLLTTTISVFKTPKKSDIHYLFGVMLSLCTITVAFGYFRAYYNLNLVWPIISDLVSGSILVLILLKFRLNLRSRTEKDFLQIVIILTLAIPFIYYFFNFQTLDIEILMMARIVIYAIMGFYGVFRNKIHIFVSWGILINVFGSIISAISIVKYPGYFPLEIRVFLYVIWIHLIKIGILKTNEVLSAKFS